MGRASCSAASRPFSRACIRRLPASSSPARPSRTQRGAIGLIGEALTTEIAIDRDELEDVRWFDAPEVAAMLERRHPDGLSLPMPFAIAHHLVLAALSQPPASPNDAAISAR